MSKHRGAPSSEGGKMLEKRGEVRYGHASDNNRKSGNTCFL